MSKFKNSINLAWKWKAKKDTEIKDQKTKNSLNFSQLNRIKNTTLKHIYKLFVLQKIIDEYVGKSKFTCYWIGKISYN